MVQEKIQWLITGFKKNITLWGATCGAGTDYTVRAPLQYHIEKPGSGWFSELGRWI